MRFPRFPKSIFVGLVFAVASALPAQAIDIIWNYDYDTDGFFTEERKLVLEAVSNRLSHITIDTPDLPQPEAPGSWLWNFNNPSTLEAVSINGSLLAESLTVYVGAYDIGGTTIGRGGHVGWSTSGPLSPEWIAGAVTLNTADTFKAFAGTLSITTSSSYTWYSGISDEIPFGQIDLYTVVLHEIGHVLGIGTAPAWSNKIVDGYFLGANTVALTGTGVKINSAGGHFDNVSWEGSPLVMNAAITSGSRYHWSVVEDAVLKDLGYVVIPEPGTIGFAVVGLGLLVAAHRRRNRQG